MAPAALAAAAAAAVVVAGAVAGAAGCRDRPPPRTSCGDDLRGVYVEDPGTAGDSGGSAAAAPRRWMLLDARETLEAYPLFEDVTAAAAAATGLEIAPRMIRLSRSPAGVTGEVVRRYMRGPRACLAKLPARLTACAGDTLELVLADPAPPLDFEPACTWPRPGSSRRERWRRAPD